jgi:hypothetical protein
MPEGLDGYCDLFAYQRTGPNYTKGMVPEIAHLNVPASEDNVKYAVMVATAWNFGCNRFMGESWQEM